MHSKHFRNPPHAPGANVLAGDIIITNHTSYIDVLYFTFKYNPVFATVPTEWDANTKVRVVTVASSKPSRLLY